MSWGLKNVNFRCIIWTKEIFPEYCVPARLEVPTRYYSKLKWYETMSIKWYMLDNPDGKTQSLCCVALIMYTKFSLVMQHLACFVERLFTIVNNKKH